MILFAFLLALSTAFINVSEAQRKIINGYTASEAQFPYQAFFSYDNDMQCSASIIHPRWALTAAHCISPYEGSVVLTVGTNRLHGEDRRDYRVEIIYVHPSYVRLLPGPNVDHPVLGNDIALLRLSTDILFDYKVQPVRLPSDNWVDYQNQYATVAGWGQTSFGSAISEYLQYMRVLVIDQETCSHHYFLLNSHICTSTAEQTTCGGDSGAPIIIDGVQVGIVSGGAPYCSSKSPSLDTRLSSFLPWIRQQMSQYNDRLY